MSEDCYREFVISTRIIPSQEDRQFCSNRDFVIFYISWVKSAATQINFISSIETSNLISTIILQISRITYESYHMRVSRSNPNHYFVLSFFFFSFNTKIINLDSLFISMETIFGLKTWEKVWASAS